MRIINRGRGNGKTSMLISTAYITGMPLICDTMKQKENIYHTAEKMGVLNGIEFYTVDEWLRMRGRHRPNEKVLVDNVDLMLGRVLSEYLCADVAAGTMQVPMDGYMTIKEN